MCLHRFSCRDEVSGRGCGLERSWRTLPRFLVPLRGAGCLLQRGIHLKTTHRDTHTNTNTRWLSVHFVGQELFLIFLILQTTAKDHQDESMAQMHLHVLCRYQEILSSDAPLNFARLSVLFVLMQMLEGESLRVSVCVCLCVRVTYSYLHKFKQFRNAGGFFGE